MTEASIRKISSVNVRNRIRGILAASAEVSKADIFDWIYHETNGADRQSATNILSQAQLEKKITLSLPFPPAPPEPSHLESRDSLTSQAFLASQERRMKKYSGELKAFVDLVVDLNRFFESYSVLELGNTISRIVNDYGYSIHITRKVLSILSRFDGDAEMKAALNPYASGLLAKRHIINRALHDAVDPTRNYTGIRRNFLRLANSGRLSRASRGLLQFNFSPIHASEDEWLQRARAHAAYSLPDFLMYVLESGLIADRFGIANESVKAITLPNDVKDVYTASRTSAISERLDRTSDGTLSAEHLYRHGVAWLCDKTIFDFYAPIELYAGPRLNADFGAIRPFITSLPYDITLFRGSPNESHDELPSSLDRRLKEFLSNAPTGLKADEFQRTILLVNSVENGAVFSDLTGIELLLLLEKTQNIPLLLSTSEIDGAFPPCPNDRLYEMLRTTLLFDSQETILTDYNLRTATEALVAEDFNGNVVDLLQFIYRLSPSIATYYVTMWDENFLVQCYRLFKSAYEVNAARAAILDWYGHEANAAALVERARSLALENKLTLIRHDIDSQRLYVDLVRFKQWLAETLADPLRSVADTAASQEVPGDDADLVDEVEAILKPEYELARIINTAFREFCINKAYGVDSYIGRRIRHGTFSGTLHKGVTDLSDDILEQLKGDRGIFEDDLRNWLTSFDDEVKRFARERLQIRSPQKPRGLLVPDILVPTRLRSVQFAISELKHRLTDRKSIPEALEALSQACWILLEPDVIGVRLELERWRREKLTLTRENFRIGFDPRLEDHARMIVRRVNERIDQLIHQITAWFAIPKEITPSATIHELFHVVRNEVAEQVPGFSPKVIESEGPDVRIVGHRYQYVYDALYVLVHNAARHGRAGGNLTLKLNQWVENNIINVDVTVKSEFPEQCENLRARIEEAMEAPMADALVTEGSTGIRKLRALAAARMEISDVKVSFCQEGVSFTFHLAIAAV